MKMYQSSLLELLLENSLKNHLIKWQSKFLDGIIFDVNPFGEIEPTQKFNHFAYKT
jgi:hypothetical protein